MNFSWTSLSIVLSPLEDDGVVFGQSWSCKGNVIEFLLFEPDRLMRSNRCHFISSIFLIFRPSSIFWSSNQSYILTEFENSG